MPAARPHPPSQQWELLTWLIVGLVAGLLARAVVWRHRLAFSQEWPCVTARDIATLAGERKALMRVPESRTNKSYGEIEREIAEYELRDLRAGYATRPAPGIGFD
jgi:hypothetical protein